MSVLLPINRIRTDGGTQPRAALDINTIRDYAELLHNGVKFPPVDVFWDRSEYWLADGFHRLRAMQEAGLARPGFCTSLIESIPLV